jgi:hypothetical protein
MSWFRIVLLSNANLYRYAKEKYPKRRIRILNKRNGVGLCTLHQVDP